MTEDDEEDRQAAGRIDRPVSVGHTLGGDWSISHPTIIPRAQLARQAASPRSGWHDAPVQRVRADHSTPPASVVVPTHRGGHRLPALLEALAAQDHDGPWELIVVLDGVLDDTPELLEQWADRLPLRVITLPTPHGVVTALNTGYAAATGDVVLRCDDDITPAPDWLRRHLAHHATGEDIGVVSATRDVFDDTPYARVYGRPANERTLAAAYARDEDHTWISWAACNSVRRTSFERVGGFDPAFAYGQDSDLGWRLHSTGTRIVVDPALEVLHRGPTTTTAVRASRAWISGASVRAARRAHPDRPAPAPPPARGLGRVWAVAVTALAALIRSPRAAAAWGRRVDALLPLIPQPVAARLVALVIEAAGRSGQRRGADDLRIYREQKRTELARELGDRRDGRAT